MTHDPFQTLVNIVPSKLYHKSNPSNRGSILRHGLLPSVGSSYKLHWDHLDIKLCAAVFMCDHAEYNSTYDDDLWEIDMTNWNHSLYVDDGMYNDKCNVVSYCAIPIDRLTLIYYGSDNDLLFTPRLPFTHEL